jgi:aldose 1-epimerase
MKHLQLLVPMLPLIAGLLQGGDALAQYGVSEKNVEGHTTYHLTDSSRKMEAGIVPDIGNFAYEFKANGKDVLIPPDSLTAYLRRRGFGSGIPFLAPYANRINQEYYYFEGKKYLLNDAIGNLQRDQVNHPIHGLLVFETRWRVIKSGASDSQGAFVTSRLEFYKYPDLMEQFPFAHIVEMTYRLKDGKLQNTTELHNLGGASMPVHIGFHPYFLPDGPRQDWILSVPAKSHWILDKQLIPTGEKESSNKYLPGSKNFRLGETFIDDNFSDLERDAEGLGRISVKGQTHNIELVYGKEYDYAVVYAPVVQTLVCIEPQTGPTNAFNLNHDGKFPGLIVLSPGKTFTANFWIVPTGF